MPVIKVARRIHRCRARQAGRDLVLLHSLLADRSAFGRAAPLLAKTPPPHARQSSRLRRLDAAGPRVEDTHLLAGLFGALRLPPRGTDVLGNGFGGFIAVALAARHGASFDRLVVVDSLAAFPAPPRNPCACLRQTSRNRA